jgi:hypothetical protein
MNINKVVKLANYFYALAECESLPADAKDLKTILKNIEELETYTARKDYAAENLERLSSGSSRITFVSPDKTVIKMAQNDKGIAQNKAECNPKLKSKFINKILDKASNYSWIEVPFLDKITEKDWKEMTGIDFDDFDDAISYGLKNVSDNSEMSKPKNFDDVKDSEIYKEIVKISKETELMPGDIGRISSWGSKDGNPVLIDAGLTKNVYEEFYDDNSSRSEVSS